MLLNCKSCLKKFIVPDSAITISGRLVQCSFCGNKWTQYPIENTDSDIKKSNKIKAPIRVKDELKKNKTKKKLYTNEYLQKKHGIVIKDYVDKEKETLSNSKGKKNGLGFYGFVFILFIFLITLFGILNLLEEIIILKYPATEIYINYFYEVIDIMKISLKEFTN